MTSLVLSVDELRAAARLAAVPVPPVVADDDPDDPRIDLTALRGLAARGLVVGLAEADPEPTGILAAALAALDEPTWLLDVERQGPGGPPSPRWNSVVGPRGTTSVTALLGGLVQMDLGAHPDVVGDLADRCGLGAHDGLLDPLFGGEDEGFEVSAAAHVEADALALAGDLDAAVAALVDAGAPAALARRWVDAVAGRRSAAAVQVVRRIDDVAIEVRELRWLVDGDGHVWLVDSGPGGDADAHSARSDDGFGAETGDAERSRVRRFDVGLLRAMLADLVIDGSGPSSPVRARPYRGSR